MADVRMLIREEGRTARNLVTFNVPMNGNEERLIRKPPSVPRVVTTSNFTKRNNKTTARVRSASTGRDKKSELQARYWAFLFGNLQRAIDGIYQTCEEDENISECKEVILVLENYTRDFVNLIEWFKVKWAYENSPPPLRRTPLAWEVRKTSPCRAWNSSMTPKCSSPLQRLSPTCPSPVDQIIFENKLSGTPTTNNYSNSTREILDIKIKDNKTSLTKKDFQISHEKYSSGKENDKSISEKPVPSTNKIVAKGIVKSATMNRINCNMNSRRLSSDFNNRDSRNQNVNKENRETVSEILKRSNPISDIERVKIKTNVALNEISKIKNSRNNMNNNKSSNQFNNLWPSRSRSRITPQYTNRPVIPKSMDQILSQPPKITRSKTTLSVREVFSVNKLRPGSSVMVRGRAQYIRNNIELQQESNDISGSVEVLTKQSINNNNRRTLEDSDGWQTVRGRYRRGSSHSLNMSTRFHKPTTATSLPALSIDSSYDKKKNINLLSTSIANPDEKYTKNEMNRVDDFKNNKSVNNRKGDINNKSAESEGKNDNVESNIDLETNSTSMIAAVFKNEAELLEKKIRQFMLAQAERERIILEEERKTEEADSKRSQQLSDEEASLKRQIQELESAEIDIDTETDETDGEMILETEESDNLTDKSMDIEVVDDISLEDRYENMLEGMSWAERVDTLEQLKVLVTRHPGRALELHQKLSSPSRKRSLPETLRRYQAKQACAEYKRQKLLLEKSQRLRELFNKVEDVKNAKNQLTENKRIRMEMKLKRAEENRTQHLLEIVRKAHDEDSKLKEIAFINELEAQNKRHDFMALCQEQEERLQGIQEERQRRQEEKAAKEAAAEERRRALEAERQRKIQKMRQTRREREERVGKMQLEREKERQELAREKARDREERLSALHAAQLANQEELQKKIAQKQQESARRHGENIEHIRQRAVELSILRMEEIPPVLKSYSTQKQCILCNILIKNEVSLVSHLRSKQHLDAVKKMHDNKESSRDEIQKFNIAQIKDTLANNVNYDDDKNVKEKQKALKRRSRKLKQRLVARGSEYSNSQSLTIDNKTNVESINKNRFKKSLKELDRLCINHTKNTGSNVAVVGLEKSLGEIGRIFIKSDILNQNVFNYLRGFDTLTNLLNLGINSQNNLHNLSNKSLLSIFRVYKAAVNNHPVNVEVVLLSNKIIVILDFILQKFEMITSLDDQAQSQDVMTNGSNRSVITAAIQLLCSLLPEVPFDKPTLHNRVHDIIGYLVAGGLIERITRYNDALIESDFYLDQDHESPLILASYDLLHRLCCQIKRTNNDNLNISNTDSEQNNIESHILNYLESTEVAGVVGCLYATYALANQKLSSPTPAQNTWSPFSKMLAVTALKLLKTIGEIDLHLFQRLLGTDSTALQWRLIASHMIIKFLREQSAEMSDLNQDSTPSAIQILSELFVVLGYFAVNNVDNQLILQTAGSGPSVLQHLCTLPFPFYGDPKLFSFTFPTLLAATHKNIEAINILSCEMSYQLLEEYRESADGKHHPLIRLLKD